MQGVVEWNGDHLIQFITQSDTAIPQVARQFRNFAAQGRPGDVKASLLNPARARIKAGFSVGLMDVRRRETKGHVRSVLFQTVERGIVKFDGAIRHAHIVPQVNWRNQAMALIEKSGERAHTPPRHCRASQNQSSRIPNPAADYG